MRHPVIYCLFQKGFFFQKIEYQMTYRFRHDINLLDMVQKANFGRKKVQKISRVFDTSGKNCQKNCQNDVKLL